MIVLVIVAAFFLLVVCFADALPPSKPPKGYCCESLWRYGTCTCPNRDQNIGW